jgi:hypothetical protein
MSDAILSERMTEGFAVRDRAIGKLEDSVTDIRGTLSKLEAEMQTFRTTQAGMNRVIERFDDFDEKMRLIENAARFVCSKKTWGAVFGIFVFAQWLVDRISPFLGP